MGHRLLEPPRLMKQDAALVGGILVAGIELEHMLKTQERMVAALQFQEHITKLIPQRGVVGLKLHGLVKRLERVIAPALPQQRRAKTCKKIRSRIPRDRARDPLQR